MNTLPNNLKQIAFFLQRLPGIGEKTANRLAFYFLRMPDSDLKTFADNITDLKIKTKMCKICMNLTEENVCSIDQDQTRDKNTITVVEEVLDLIAFETGNIYQGVYHVLHGRIDPLNHVGPDEIFIDKLLNRIKVMTGSSLNSTSTNGLRGEGGLKKGEIKEIVLATNPDMEGEATAMYIRDRLNDLQKKTGSKFKITRLAYGLPIGGNLEYADYMTLKKAIDGRNKF